MKMFLNLSQLAYEDAPEIAKYFGAKENADLKWTFASENFISTTNGKDIDTQAFVASSPTDIIVAFRGTEPFNPIDWATDRQVEQADISQFGFLAGMKQPGAKIHEGIGNAFVAAWPKVKDAVTKCDDPSGVPKRLWITGHSLGGALATLAAAAFKITEGREVTAVYTFGQPRVGNEAFAQEFNDALKARFLRVVNDQDLIARLPPWEGVPQEKWTPLKTPTVPLFGPLPPLSLPGVSVERYQHVGMLKWLDKCGRGHRELPPDDYGNHLEGYVPDFAALWNLSSFAAGSLGKEPEQANLEKGLGGTGKGQLCNPRLANHSWSSVGTILGPGYLQRIEADGSQDETLSP